LKHGAPGPGSSIPATAAHRHFLLDKLRELLGDFTHMTTRIQSILIVLMLLFLGFLPQMQAVSPAPDGCYPGFTTAEGCNALKFLTTGAGNTGVGWYSLYVNTTGNYNTGVGAGTLILNTADSNTAVGTAALLLNTTGSNNTAVGTDALVYNDTGSSDTATGAFALFSNTVGSSNAAFGASALYHNTEGTYNTAVGSSALASHIIGDRNTAIGYYALQGDTTGERNTAVGGLALYQNTSGTFNVAIGVQALSSNTEGGGNIALGFGAGDSVTTANNVICIGASGENVNASCYIGNIFNATSSLGTAVFVNSAGKLGTTTSSRRFKDDIKPMDQASEAILALKPVTFRYKQQIDPKGVPQFGLVAEEVEKVNSDLVVRDKEGKPYSVRYDQVNAMLLNEFLKEHRKAQQQEATITQLKKDFDATIAQLTARLDEQATQIQKVSVQMEASKAAPPMVANSH